MVITCTIDALNSTHRGRDNSATMTTFIRAAIVCVMVAAASPRSASACTCALRPACASFWEADLVFTGRAEVTPLGPGAQRTQFRVEESFRGPTGSVVEIVARGIGGSCAYAFVHGTTYLVFARRAADGTWSSSFCDPTGPLDQAGESLTFAREVSRGSRPGGSLVGSVLVTQRAPDQQGSPPSPLGGVTVAIRDGRVAFSTITNPQGQYRFQDIAPGRYTVIVTAPTGVDRIPPAVIRIGGPGACAFHTVTAFRAGG